MPGSSPGMTRSSRRSERVPGRALRKFEIADIGAEPQADAGADRNQHDVVGGERGHAEAADDIGRTVDAGEALVDRVGGRQVVDQRHGARAVAAPVEADRWPLPVDPQVAGVLGVKRSLAVAEPRDKRARTFFAEDVAVLQAPLADRAFDHRSQTARDIAEELVAGTDQFIRPVSGWTRLALRWRQGRGGGSRGGSP